jgi:hypothetical protein
MASAKKKGKAAARPQVERTPGQELGASVSRNDRQMSADAPVGADELTGGNAHMTETAGNDVTGQPGQTSENAENTQTGADARANEDALVDGLATQTAGEGGADTSAAGASDDEEASLRKIILANWPTLTTVEDIVQKQTRFKGLCKEEKNFGFSTAILKSFRELSQQTRTHEDRVRGELTRQCNARRSNNKLGSVGIGWRGKESVFQQDLIKIIALAKKIRVVWRHQWD